MKRRDFLAWSAIATASGMRNTVASFSPPDLSIVGANTALSGYGLYEAIETLGELGFHTIELHPMGILGPTPGQFPGFHFNLISDNEKRKIQKLLKSFRHVTTHLPYVDLNFFSRFAPIADFSNQQLKISMEATSFLGAELGVIHVTRPTGGTLKQSWKMIIQQFRNWGNIAAQGNFRLAIETGYPQSVRDFVQLIKEIDHDWVGCTVDVGHQTRYKEFLAKIEPGKPATEASIQAYNDVTHEIIDQLDTKIFHLHIDDIDPETWKEHRPIGTGVIDFPRLIKKLNRINYEGLLVLEIGGPEIRTSLADSKSRLEKMLSQI